jgi:hypothetical protein
MMAAETQEDMAFTARALDALPPVTASPALRGAMRAAFDEYQARRRLGLRAALRRFSDIIWPGAPAWAPGAALAAALVLGLGIGVALPYPAAAEERGVFSLDEPPSFSLGGPDLTESL